MSQKNSYSNIYQLLHRIINELWILTGYKSTLSIRARLEIPFIIY